MKNILINCNNQNKSILFFTNNEQVIDNTQTNNSSLEKHVYCKSIDDFTQIIEKVEKFDILVFDTRCEEDIITFELLYKKIKNIDISIILIGEEIENVQELLSYNKIFTFIPTSISNELINTTIQLCQNYINSKKILNFKGGLYFDYNLQSLLYNKEIIQFTKSETMIISLLIQNLNEVVSYAELEDYLWKDKKFSKDTLRNKIKHIREKTNTTFISNVSKKGYKIEDL